MQISRLIRYLLVVMTSWMVISCGGDDVVAPTQGSIQIQTATHGTDLDPDGYLVTVDRAQPAGIGVSDQMVVNDLNLGRHQVTLSGLASNCTTDAPFQTISVVGGDTVIVAFDVTCTSLTGGGGDLLRERSERISHLPIREITAELWLARKSYPPRARLDSA